MPFPVEPHIVRRGAGPYGSATLFLNRRVGPGSVITSSEINVTRSAIKTFGFRGNVVGSYFIDATLAGSRNYFAIAEGTFPAGPGSMKMVSFESAALRARARVRMSSVGSVSVFYGGIAPEFR